MSHASRLSALQVLKLYRQALLQADQTAVIILGRNFWARRHPAEFQEFIDLIRCKTKKGVRIDLVIDWRQYAVDGRAPIAALIESRDEGHGNLSVWTYAQAGEQHPDWNWPYGICTEDGIGFVTAEHPHEAVEMVVYPQTMAYEEYRRYATGAHAKSPHKFNAGQVMVISNREALRLLGEGSR